MLGHVFFDAMHANTLLSREEFREIEVGPSWDRMSTRELVLGVVVFFFFFLVYILDSYTYAGAAQDTALLDPGFWLQL